VADEEASTGHDPTVVMYFLDVLSSGLGASILLFLVFSVLPHFGDAGGGRQAGAGAGATRGEAGAAGEQLDPLARNAVVRLQVSIERPGKPVDGNEGQWPDLPFAPDVVFTGFQKLGNSPNQLLFEATCLRGLSPERKVTFVLRGPLRTAFTARATAAVGGLVQQKTVEFKPKPGGDRWLRAVTQFPTKDKPPDSEAVAAEGKPLEVVRFDLQHKGDWITLP
jgi:hypothetical protein